MAPEDAQLYYQIGLMGQRDLPLAPDPLSGFEMVLLRMLAFRPVEAGEPRAAPGDRGVHPTRVARASVDAAAARRTSPSGAQPAPAPTQARSGSEPTGAIAAQPEGDQPDLSDWHAVTAALGLRGIAAQLADNCVPDSWDGQALTLRLDPSREQLRVASAEQRLKRALEDYLGRALKVDIQCRSAQPDADTPARRAERLRGEQQRAAEREIEEDPLINALRERMDARVLSGTVRPAEGAAPAGSGRGGVDSR
jgi:DNA polymerase-3 subunit gamma/tau